IQPTAVGTAIHKHGRGESTQSDEKREVSKARRYGRSESTDSDAMWELWTACKEVCAESRKSDKMCKSSKAHKHGHAESTKRDEKRESWKAHKHGRAESTERDEKRELWKAYKQGRAESTERDEKRELWKAHKQGRAESTERDVKGELSKALKHGGAATKSGSTDSGKKGASTKATKQHDVTMRTASTKATTQAETTTKASSSTPTTQAGTTTKASSTKPTTQAETTAKASSTKATTQARGTTKASSTKPTTQARGTTKASSTKPTTQTGAAAKSASAESAEKVIVGAATNPNTEWSFYNKFQPTVANSTGNYSLGGEGLIHVASYNCNSNPKNRVAGYCILTIPDAVAQCNRDANCGGYEATTNVGWHNAYDVNGQTVVNLFAVGAATNPNTEWSFYNKFQPTVANSTGNYSLGGEGLIHVASYNCNSNPKNRVAGYCILTIPDAVAQCNSDANCGGYEATTNVGWHNAYDVNGQTVVNLFAVGAATNPNTEWSFYNKFQPIVANSIGNYSLGGQGLIHVTAYNCNSNPKNRVAGYCVLTIPDAVAHCNSDANCGGYDATTNVGWHNAYDLNGQTVVQLFAVGAATNPNTEWSFYNKFQPTVANSTGNYSLGGEGLIHVASYNCNSNPKNRVAGYCILTIPDAVAQCNRDANCGGYEATTNVGWHNAYDLNGQTVVQLFAVGAATNPNTEWSFYNKFQPIVANSTGNYSLGGEGLIHVASYNCNSNPKNRVAGYCILTIPDAVAQCNRDANCGGYEATTNVGWHNAYDVNGQTVVKLFAVGAATNPNTEWSFYNKFQPIVANSIGNYSLGGQGLIHVTLYNCNSNPKNRAPGFCVLTIPDAEAQCNTDPNCGGYDVTTNIAWHLLFDVNGQTVVQLFAVGAATLPNTEWKFYNKYLPKVGKSIGNYSLGGQGLIHVTLYNCNSNPKNRAPGFCVLTIPDAVAQCNRDPNCGGYDVTTNIAWHLLFDVNGQPVVQLFKLGSSTLPNTEWEFYSKPATTGVGLGGSGVRVG
ncbi:unnamed protein product, partial [Rotaria magnacalcarata]